jgi:hypothetical protein
MAGTGLVADAESGTNNSPRTEHVVARAGPVSTVQWYISAWKPFPVAPGAVEITFAGGGATNELVVTERTGDGSDDVAGLGPPVAAPAVADETTRTARQATDVATTVIRRQIRADVTELGMPSPRRSR